MLGVSLFISCKNKIQCVCVEEKKKSECYEGQLGKRGDGCGAALTWARGAQQGSLVLLVSLGIQWTSPAGKLQLSGEALSST